MRATTPSSIRVGPPSSPCSRWGICSRSNDDPADRRRMPRPTKIAAAFPFAWRVVRALRAEHRTGRTTVDAVLAGAAHSVRAVDRHLDHVERAKPDAIEQVLTIGA